MRSTEAPRTHDHEPPRWWRERGYLLWAVSFGILHITWLWTWSADGNGADALVSHALNAANAAAKRRTGVADVNIDLRKSCGRTKDKGYACLVNTKQALWLASWPNSSQE